MDEHNAALFHAANDILSDIVCDISRELEKTLWISEDVATGIVDRFIHLVTDYDGEHSAGCSLPKIFLHQWFISFIIVTNLLKMFCGPANISLARIFEQMGFPED